MKAFTAVFASVIFIFLAGSALAEVVVRQEPLTWEKVAKLDGETLYGNLCSSCHGAGGKGNGPVAGVMDRHVPDLTIIAAKNDGVFSHKGVENVIYGKTRVDSHGTIDMPAWGQQFMYLRTGWTSFQRESYTRNRIHTLTKYIESLQG